MVIFIAWVVMTAIPDMPSSVRLLLLRERHLAKEARYASVFVGVHEDKKRRLDALAKLA